MIRSAQQLFAERTGKENEKEDVWPHLAAVPTIDRAFAESLIGHDKENEPLAALLCYLMCCAREGHLCIRIEGNTLFPDPANVWEEVDDLTPLIHEGVAAIPDALLTDIKEECPGNVVGQPFEDVFGGVYYLFLRGLGTLGHGVHHFIPSFDTLDARINGRGK